MSMESRRMVPERDSEDAGDSGQTQNRAGLTSGFALGPCHAGRIFEATLSFLPTEQGGPLPAPLEGTTDHEEGKAAIDPRLITAPLRTRGWGHSQGCPAWSGFQHRESCILGDPGQSVTLLGGACGRRAVSELPPALTWLVSPFPPSPPIHPLALCLGLPRPPVSLSPLPVPHLRCS